MMLIVTQRKGGSGKTALAVNLAALIAQEERTLLVDLDPQGDASARLAASGTGKALADAVLGRAPLIDAIRSTEWGVDVAVGGERVGHVAQEVRASAVEAALEPVRERYGCIVIDCSQTLSPLVQSAWRADPAAIPLLPIDGISALRVVSRVCTGWEDTRLDPARLRLVMTRYDRRRVLDRDVYGQAEAMYPGCVLDTTIREAVVVGESEGWRQPLTAYAAEHRVTRDFRSLAAELAS